MHGKYALFKTRDQNGLCLFSMGQVPDNVFEWRKKMIENNNWAIWGAVVNQTSNKEHLI